MPTSKGSLPPETPKNLDRFSSNGTFGNDSQASASHAEHANLMWGMWQKTANWQDKLHRRAAHKALNIPEEDVITSTNISHNGVGWKELAILVLGGSAAFFGWNHMTGDKEEPRQGPAAVVQPHPGWEVIVTDPGASKVISTEEVTWENSSSQ